MGNNENFDSNFPPQTEKKRRTPPLLTREAKLILLSVLLNSIPIGYMNVVPFVYLHDIGFGASLIGIIYAASAVANTVALIPFGLLADKYGRKKFLIIGTFLPALSYAIYGFTVDPYWLIIASIVGGVGFAGGLAVAISSPALLPLIADSTTDQNRTNVFGLTQGVWTIALTIGALLSFIPGLLISILGEPTFTAHSVSYYFMALLVLTSGVPLFFIHEVRRGGVQISSLEAPDALQRGTTIISRFTRRVAIPKFSIASGKEIAKFSAVFALSGLGLGVIVQLLPLWYNLKFGTSESATGLWIAIAEFVAIITLPIIPRIAKRRGTLASSALTMLIGAIILGFMPLPNSFVFAASLFVVRSIFGFMSWPILQSYMMGVVQEKVRASAVGIATTAWGLANSIGTLVGGVILGAGLLSLPFVIGVIGYGGGAILLYFFFKKIKPPEERI
jgi:MFS family permease